MTFLLDLAYLAAALISAPVWLVRMIRTGKIRTDWPARFGRTRLPSKRARRVLIHAVSVGEVNALRQLVGVLQGEATGIEIVIATTTDTGFARAQDLFGEEHGVVRYPFDFGPFVRRFLRAVAPDAVVLVELEVWPNFVRRCAAEGIPVGVINGRLSARSYERYRRIRPLLRRTFERLAWVAAQEEPYAERFVALGVPPERVRVTGTMKWDTARIEDDVEGAQTLAAQLGVGRDRPLVVAGSTAPDETDLLERSVPRDVQLLLAPRKPEWFDDVARRLPGCARRTRDGRSTTGRFVLDTIGELRQAYALADLVVVGRTFGTLHGSDMMEPIALGKATIIGPAVDDFRATVEALLEGDALVQTTAEDLGAIVQSLLDDPPRRRELATNGRRVIRDHQGATARHARLILETLDAQPRGDGSAGGGALDQHALSA